jgi:O-antigen ligase
MSNITMETSDHRTVPLWKLVITGPLVIVLLKCAGATFISTQDAMAGDIITQSGSVPNALAAKIFGYSTEILLLAILLPYYRRIATEFRENYLVTATFVLALASIAWSQDSLMTLRALYWLILSISFVFWMSTKLPLARQMQLLMITGTAAGLISILVVVFIPTVGLDRLHENVWEGIFTSKNHMGRIFLFLLTPAIHYKTKTLASNWAKLLYIALMFFLIGMTQSKSAWIFTILYLFLAFLLNRLGRVSTRDKYIAVGFTLFVISAVSFLVITNLDAILLLFGRDSSLTGRTTIWKVLLASITKRPWFGFGYQAFWAGTSSEGINAFMGTYYLMHFVGSYAHSGYLSVLLENGIVGLGLIVLLVLKSGKDALVCIGRAQAPVINWYIGIIVLTLFYNIDEVTFMLPSYLPWMMFLLAVIGLSREAHRICSPRSA